MGFIFLRTVLVLSALALTAPAHAQISSSTWGQGAIRTGSSTTTCDASAEGAIRYNTTSDVLEYCNGTAWNAMGGSASYSDYTTNLIGWWKFDESSGTTAADSSGNSRNGTLVNGPTWQSSGGKIGGALACDGTNDHVTIADNAAWDVTNLTIMAWVNKKTSDHGWFAGIFTREYSTGGNDAFALSYDSTSSDNISYYTYLSSSASLIASSYTTQVPGYTTRDVNNWVHFAATWDGSNMRLYRNGEFLAAAPGSGSMPAQTNRLVICANDNSTNTASEFANIWVDDVRFYNTALTHAQIYQVYRAAGGVP